VIVLTLAHFAFGATQPVATLAIAAALITAAIVTIVLAGPRHVTIGMAVGIAAIAVFAFTSAGNLDRAAPHLATLLAAGAMCAVGYVCARRRGALDIAWSGLIWSSLAYCVWMFVAEISARLSDADLGVIADAFESPAAASLLFGLFAVLGSTRVLHVVKQIDAEALPRSEAIDRLMRGGLGGFLLMGFSLTCLVLAGSDVGVLLTAGVMLGHAAWDTAPIASRPHRSLAMRIAHHVTPFVALGLAGWGVALAWLTDESVAPGIGVPDTLTHLQRLEVYGRAWLERPAFGHGLGSIDAVANSAMTLWNVKAMSAPGDAQNVFLRWLVEAGAVGLAMLLIALVAIHARMLAAMSARKAPRTFARLAIAAGALMLLHGVSDSSLGLPSAVWFYALLLGAASGVATTKRSERQRPADVIAA
jgi:O-antigen ligase